MVWPKSQLTQAIAMYWLFYTLDKVQNTLGLISLKFISSSNDYGIGSSSWTVILECGTPNMILVGVPKWLGLLRLGIFLRLLMGVNLVVCPFLSHMTVLLLPIHPSTYLSTRQYYYPFYERNKAVLTFKNFHLSIGERHANLKFSRCNILYI